MSATARKSVRIELGPRSYEVVCGTGLLATTGARVAPYAPRGRAAVVTDANVARLHLETVLKSLGDAGVEADAVVVPPGEASKSWRELERVCDFLLEADLERAEPIIALGGGVVGDLTGLAAALYKRGAPYIQIPTTLLAQVDSSVGGKTAINARAGKNLIGAFHQPVLVLADVDALATLEARDLRAGVAEVIKTAMVADADFFDWLESNVAALLGGDRAAQTEAVARSVAHKAAIVAQDEREAGKRALLNLGHTFGHAFETLAGYQSGLRHGEAVAAGMGMAAAYASETGLCPTADAERLTRLISTSGLEADPRALDGAPFDPAAALGVMRHDKKNVAGKLRLVLPTRVGAAEVVSEQDMGRLERFMGERLT